MRQDHVAIGDDTYETTTLPVYTSVSSRRHDQIEDMYLRASCENMGVSALILKERKKKLSTKDGIGQHMGGPPVLLTE